MINSRIIARVFSLMLIAEAFFMMVSGVISLIFGEYAAPFFYSALITAITGIIVFTPLRKEEKITGNKEGYIIITGSWLIFSLFGMLPYLLSHSVNNFTDAFFESVSGFTTTGATIFDDVESLKHGILFWRSLTQWLGGIGIIFISLYVLPVFKSIYIQLPAGDFTGQPPDKIHPRIRDAARRLIFIYCTLTFSEAVLLSIGGIPFFDSLCHSFSTLSTGGFSTMNHGIGSFWSPYIIAVITVFMFISGMNMTVIYFGIKGNFRKILGNNEFLFYTVISAGFIVAVSLILYFKSGITADRSILEGAFHVVSIITTTGYFLDDHAIWGDLIMIIFFVLMFTGGTAGSTSGGIKIARLLVVTKNSKEELKRLIHPNAFLPVRFDKRNIPQTVIFNLLVFIALYCLIVCFSAFILSLMGYDIIASFSIAATMLGNIGPGFNVSGFFSTNFSEMQVTGKLFASALMIAGRLELLTVAVLFTRGFYKY
jgi:trk system potassium uptake protein TrkH